MFTGRSMSRASFTVTRNDISPALSRLAGTVRRPRPVFLAMGNVFKSITVGNFTSSGLQYRPIPWVAKKDGTPATLKRTGLLWHSFNLEVSDHGATLSNPTPYAARHQFGDADYEAGEKVGTTKTKYANYRYKGSFQDITKGGHGMPPRPFFPVKDGKLTPAAEKLIGDAGRRAIERQVEG